MDRIKTCWTMVQDHLEFKQKIAVVIATVGCVVVIHNAIKRSRLRRKILDKKESCRLSLEKMSEKLYEDGLNVAERDKILELSFEDLQSQLQSGKLTSVTVVKAYMSKALQVNKDLNCVVEPIWEAESWALELDMRSGKKGPLHGIPISIKENFYLQGYDSTSGLSCYIDKPAQEDNIVVKVLKKQGAIPFVRTNIPQTLMSFECSNPIYGETKNPYDVTRSPGGSSGGEGSLIGAQGSILGFGTDIGGSIRIPCHMCGLYGLKPTIERVSCKTINQFGKGQPLIKAALGPMAQDVNTLVSVMKALLVPYMSELDPTVPPIPFRNEIFEDKRPLRIGYYDDNGYIKAVPACQRALHEVKAVLEKKGHTLVPFKPLDARELFELYLQSNFGDGFETYRNTLKEDEIDYTVKLVYLGMSLPGWLSSIVTRLLSFVGKDDMLRRIPKAMRGTGSVLKYWDVTFALESYKRRMLARWREIKLDALICPGFAYPAFPSGKCALILGGVTYTILFNVVNYPAGSVPVTKVTKEDIENMKHYPSKTAYEKMIHKVTVGSEGLPVNVQCAALPFQEELVLRVMKEVEEGLASK